MHNPGDELLNSKVGGCPVPQAFGQHPTRILRLGSQEKDIAKARKLAGELEV